MLSSEKLYGPAYLEKNWVPAPRYVLRRRRVLHHLMKFKPGQLLEVGAGAGTLLVDLAQNGFDCTGYEISEDAREIAKAITNPQDNIDIVAEPQSDWKEHFDFLAALEVLEHIKDDYAALKEWVDWLKPDGIAVFSVPANKSIWTPSDDWAGHYRRYDKEDLVTLLETCGLQVIEVEYYGFPIANLVAPFRRKHHAAIYHEREASGEFQSIDDHNLQSGVERKVVSGLYKYMEWLPVRLMFRIGFFLQHLTRHRMWAPNLLVIAQKTASASNGE